MEITRGGILGDNLYDRFHIHDYHFDIPLLMQVHLNSSKYCADVGADGDIVHL